MIPATVLATALPRLAAALGRAGPELLAKIAGALKTTPSVPTIIAAIKANPMTSMLVVTELGSLADDAYELLKPYLGSAEKPEDKLPATSAGVGSITAVDTTVVKSLKDQKEEMALITTAARVVGGVQNLLALRRALAMSDGHFELYAALRESRV